MRTHLLGLLAFAAASALAGCNASTLEPAAAPVMVDHSVATNEPIPEDPNATGVPSSGTEASSQPGQYEMSFTPSEAPPPPPAPKARKGFVPPTTVHKKQLFATTGKK